MLIQRSRSVLLSATVVAGLALVAAACGGSDSTPSTAAPTTTTSVTSTSDAPSTTEAAGSVRTVTVDTRFASPDGTVTCEIVEGFARCDVPAADWPDLPDTAASCTSPAFPSLTVATGGQVEGTCAGGALSGAAETLPAGDSIQFGDLRCTSAASSVRCVVQSLTDDRYTVGFEVDRDGFQEF